MIAVLRRVAGAQTMGVVTRARRGEPGCTRATCDLNRVCTLIAVGIPHARRARQRVTGCDANSSAETLTKYDIGDSS